MQKNKIEEKILPPSFERMFNAEHRAVFDGCKWMKQVPSDFEDSTHELWVCQFESEKRFLKLCSTSCETPSVFWQAVQGLFEFELASSLNQYGRVYQRMAIWSPLVIPNLFDSASCLSLLEEGGEDFSGFLLTTYLEGQGLTTERLTLKQVSQIAEHVALLHQYRSPCFGALFEEGVAFSHKNKTRWKCHLKQTLLMLNKNQTIPVETMDRTVGLVNQLNINGFYPIMLDFRWDQFLQLGGGEKLALLDLDAMVWAPKELELVMLEYLLTPKQAEAFLLVYTQYNALPDLTLARAVYRVLLFQMNVLGEQDFNRWMAHPRSLSENEISTASK